MRENKEEESMPQIANIQISFSERKVLLRLFDVLAVLLSLYLVETYFNFNYFTLSYDNFYWIIVLSIYLNVLGTIFEMYNLQVASHQFYTVRSIVFTASATVFFYLMTPVFTPLLPLNRLQILYFFIAVFGALLSWRIFYQTFLASHIFEKNAVLVCESSQVQQLIDELKEINSQYNVRGVVCINEENISFENIDGIKLLEVKDLRHMSKKYRNMEVVVAAQHTEEMTLGLYRQLQNLLDHGCVVREYTQLYEDLAQRIPMHAFNKDFYKYFPFCQGQENKLYVLSVKTVEVVLSSVALLIGGLLLPFIMLGNLLANRGSLFYAQIRVGRNGKLFKIYKFRTMVENAETNGAVFASVNDSRITPFGKFLRNTRLDEIPQFYNILKGDMGFIGPRPERPEFVKKIIKDMPFYEARHVIKPGLTGWAQVNYSYGASIDDSLIKLQYDLYYIKHRNLVLDLIIILRTITTVLFYRGQ